MCASPEKDVNRQNVSVAKLLHKTVFVVNVTNEGGGGGFCLLCFLTLG